MVAAGVVAATLCLLSLGCGGGGQAAPAGVLPCIKGRVQPSEMRFDRGNVTAGDEVQVCNATRREVPETYHLFVVETKDAERWGDAHGVRSGMEPALALGHSAVEVRQFLDGSNDLKFSWPDVAPGRYTLAWYCDQCGRLLTVAWPNIAVGNVKSGGYVIAAR